ncbi:dTDP-4-dehydrorhamnose reductase family protein [Anaerosalibacter sp. Marseille-P3206]|uniref:dTDP-4-dehydrorhamnose reductase family protein n=1 Tax=Anaerosalibacter sp. Marseille-P3206 TaxID=1871005 RepID=UPI0009876677|nr:SDR family oxidoreductase [Anaerosalibacter sp. Marseille-P3206]
MKQRILITGATGMLGISIINAFKDDNRFEVYGISRRVNEKVNDYNRVIADITDNNELLIILNDIKPDVIIHCAANTNVDSCNHNKEYAYKLHVEATHTLAKFDSRYIYISTDSVFDGQKGDYYEEDETNPLNYYAVTKLKGEKVSLNSNSKALILRTNIYGFHLEKKNSLVEWALDNLLLNKKINGFNDVYFNPVYVNQLARIIKKIVIIKDISGILNVGSKEYISKYKFLIKLAEVFSISKSLIIPKSIDDIKFDAIRPRNTTLNLDKFEYVFKEIPSIDEGIMELRNDYDNFFSNKEVF